MPQPGRDAWGGCGVVRLLGQLRSLLRPGQDAQRWGALTRVRLGSVSKSSRGGGSPSTWCKAGRRVRRARAACFCPHWCTRRLGRCRRGSLGVPPAWRPGMLVHAAQAGLGGRSVRLSQQAVGCQQLGLLVAAFTPAGQGSLSKSLLWNSTDMLPVAVATPAGKEACSNSFSKASSTALHGLSH